MKRNEYGNLIIETGDLIWDAGMASPGFIDGNTKDAPPFGGVGVASVELEPFGKSKIPMVTLNRPVSYVGGALDTNKVSFDMRDAEGRVRGPLPPERLDIMLRMAGNRSLPPLAGTYPVLSRMVYAKMMSADPQWGWVRVFRDLVEKRRRRKPIKQGLSEVSPEKKEDDAYIRFREALFWEILATEAATRGVPWTAAVDAARSKLDRTLRGSDSTLQAWV